MNSLHWEDLDKPNNCDSSTTLSINQCEHDIYPSYKRDSTPSYTQEWGRGRGWQWERGERRDRKKTCKMRFMRILCWCWWTKANSCSVLKGTPPCRDTCNQSASHVSNFSILPPTFFTQSALDLEHVEKLIMCFCENTVNWPMFASFLEYHQELWAWQHSCWALSYLEWKHILHTQ